ncbi:hypothetical protein BDZ89DRAFT_444033 [Hymenopellis radicata]|nr:hypothetical protein BDZ89DRAFT_444033 [Hymenopellis radicata]
MVVAAGWRAEARTVLGECFFLLLHSLPSHHHHTTTTSTTTDTITPSITPSPPPLPPSVRTHGAIAVEISLFAQSVARITSVQLPFTC